MIEFFPEIKQLKLQGHSTTTSASTIAGNTPVVAASNLSKTQNNNHSDKAHNQTLHQHHSDKHNPHQHHHHSDKHSNNHHHSTGK